MTQRRPFGSGTGSCPSELGGAPQSPIPRLADSKTFRSVAPCPDPSGTPEAQSEVEERKRAANRKKVLLDAEKLAGFLVRHPAGMGVRDLRNALKLEGWGWGQGRLDAAKLELKRGHKGVRLVEIDHGAGKQKELRLEREPIGGGEDDLD